MYFIFFLLHLPYVYRSCNHLKYIVLIFGYIYIYMLMYVNYLSLHVLFPFSLDADDSYLLYAIFYFYFKLRCLDEFCLKCFGNTKVFLPLIFFLQNFLRVCVMIDFIVFNK